MKKVVVLVCSLILLAIILGVLIFSFVLFPPNSVLDISIVQIDIGCMTNSQVIEEINNELKSFTYDIVTVDNEKFELSLSEITDSFNNNNIENLVSSITKRAWTTQYTLDIIKDIEINEDKVSQFLEDIEKRDNNSRKSANAEIVYNPTLNLFEIQKEKWGNEFKEDVLSIFCESLKTYDKNINMLEIGCYKEPEILEDNLILLSNLDIYNSYLGVNLSYIFGENNEVITSSIYYDWLIPQYNDDMSLNVDNPFILDKEKVSEFVDKLNSKYTTLGITRLFKTSTGQEIEITKGDYGWWLDKASMIKDISSHILDRVSEEKQGIFKQKAEVFGEIDFSDSYVEVSIEKQHLWMYINGELKVDCPVVTGNISKGHATPKGIYSLTYKTRNAVLRGPGYESPVSYWMPFNGDVGLHDATWRGSFGGSIYKINGSHGCVNMPFKSAKIVYENLTNTMPIIVW